MQMGIILTTIWQIWRAKNDKIRGQKRCGQWSNLSDKSGHLPGLSPKNGKKLKKIWGQKMHIFGHLPGLSPLFARFVPQKWAAEKRCNYAVFWTSCPLSHFFSLFNCDKKINKI